MPLDRIIYSETFHLGDQNYQKIGVEGSVVFSLTPIDMLRAARELVHSFHLETYGSKGYTSARESFIVNDSGKSDLIDKEFDEFISQLRNFEFREDAQSHLDSTSFKYSLEAKKIVDSKPLKNKL